MKSYLSKFGSYLLCFEASLWIGVLGAVLSMFLEAILTTSTKDSRILNGSLMILVAAVSLFVFLKKIGHKSGNFEPRKIIVAVVLVLIARQILGAATGYVTYISGGANDLARAIYLGSEMEPNDKSQLHQVFHWVMLSVDLLINLPVCLLAEYTGAKQRKRERYEK